MKRPQSTTRTELMPRIAPKALKEVVPKVAIKASRSPRTIKAPAFFKQTKRLKKKAFPSGIPFQAMSIGEKQVTQRRAV